MDKLIELAGDPEAFWHTTPPPEVFEQPKRKYYLNIGSNTHDIDRFALALKLLRERSHRPREA